MGRHRQGTGTDGVFRLMFVCTGNICRSPFAEILTRHLLVGRLGGALASRFEITSSGVQAVVGGDMHPDSRFELEPWGLHAAAAGRFTARQLRSVFVQDADLVLGANPRHRSSVVERSPEGLPKTFSMREFARLARAVDPAELPEHPVERAHVLVDLARKQRGLVPPVSPEDDKVPDPMGGTQEDHHQAAVLIREAVSSIVDIIAPARPAVGPVRRPAPPVAGSPPVGSQPVGSPPAGPQFGSRPSGAQSPGARPAGSPPAVPRPAVSQPASPSGESQPSASQPPVSPAVPRPVASPAPPPVQQRPTPAPRSGSSRHAG